MSSNFTISQSTLTYHLMMLQLIMLYAFKFVYKFRLTFSPGSPFGPSSPMSPCQKKHRKIIIIIILIHTEHKQCCLIVHCCFMVKYKITDKNNCLWLKVHLLYLKQELAAVRGERGIGRVHSRNTISTKGAPVMLAQHATLLSLNFMLFTAVTVSIHTWLYYNIIMSSVPRTVLQFVRDVKSHLTVPSKDSM